MVGHSPVACVPTWLWHRTGISSTQTRQTRAVSTDVQVTLDLLLDVLYHIKHVWSNNVSLLQEEGNLIGIGQSEGGSLWDDRSVDGIDGVGECEVVMFSDGRWVLENHVPCDTPVSAMVCFSPCQR